MISFDHNILAGAAVIASFLTVINITFSHRPAAGAWRWPAGASVLFGAWTLYTIATEGLFGFWPEHAQRGAWGNQIWFDLLLAFAMVWLMLLPRARAVGMRTWPWLIFFLCTGCVGLLAMLSRCLFLEARTASDTGTPGPAPFGRSVQA